ncbi:uncharacterized protein [Littorina saxatilis]|uniref:TM2 domain-containing protein n=1 Tax=Littorina saxatilis TaxID=31220 RepID=A0AAN9AJK9_9CAEN
MKMASEKRESVLHLGRETDLPSPSSNPPPPRPPPPSGAGLAAAYAPPPHVSSQAAPLPESAYWKVTPVGGYPSRSPMGAVHQGSYLAPPKKKSVLEAYILCLPLGFLGAHHFYLGRPSFGVMYLFTFGLFGAGWLIDLLRMPCLVSRVNKGNREKHEELVHLQQQLAQQQQQQQLGQQHGPQPLHNIVFVAFEPRSLADAYILWFPCGLFGFHHFYLRNYGMGFLYLFTFGLLGIGWLVDIFRMPSMVREANNNSPNKPIRTANQCTAHILALSPAGILGGHHYYLDRPIWGLLYTLTFGLCGAGWVMDWFRTHQLVKRANAMRLGLTSPCLKFVDDAYVLCIPWGFTGLHHFYLRRYGWGFLYLFTFGIFGIGWLVDWFRLPCLVKEVNANTDASCRRLITTTPHSNQAFNGAVTGTGNGGAVQNYGNQGQGPMTVVISPTQQPFGASGGVPPGYPPAAGYGYPSYQAYPGPYPSYMNGGMYQGGPPQYSAQPGSTDGPHVHVSAGPAPPPYEASAPNNQTTGTKH